MCDRSCARLHTGLQTIGFALAEDCNTTPNADGCYDAIETIAWSHGLLIKLQENEHRTTRNHHDHRVPVDTIDQGKGTFQVGPLTADRADRTHIQSRCSGRISHPLSTVRCSMCVTRSFVICSVRANLNRTKVRAFPHLFLAAVVDEASHLAQCDWNGLNSQTNCYRTGPRQCITKVT